MHLPKARIIYESRVVSSVVGIPYASIPQCAIYQHGAFEKTPSFSLLQHHHSSMFGAHWFFLWLDPVVLFALLDLVNLHGFVINHSRMDLDYVMRNHYNRLIRANEITDAQNFFNHTMQVKYNLSRNEVIYFYHHSCGYPLAGVLEPNHFGYLEPTQKPKFDIETNSIQQIFSTDQ